MSCLSQNSISKHIYEQVQRRISQKYNWKRMVSTALNKFRKKFLRLLGRYKSLKLKSIEKSINPELGFDEFGRNVSFYMKSYVSLLLNRGLKLHTVIVLGSRAKGRWTPESDVDVMVIASNLPGIKTPEFTNVAQKILNIRQKFLLMDFPLCLGVQPSPCGSKEDFLRWLKEFNVSALDAIYYGKVIYDDGFWEDVTNLYGKIKKKYKLNEAHIKKILWIL